MSLSITMLPTSTLRERSRELTKEEILSPEFQTLIRDMIPAMYENDGIGLAAPQVAVNVRLCIIGREAVHNDKRPEGKKPDPAKKDLVLINPAYQKLNKKFTKDDEGCLSVPGYYGEVKRHQEIYVTALSETGEKIEFAAKNFFARVIQHEVDHLDGHLFIDRAPELFHGEHKKKLPVDVVLDGVRKID